MKKAISGIFVITLLTLVIGGIVACAPKPSAFVPGICEQLENPFRDFCDRVGGEIIGKPLSTLLDFDGTECQFTTNFLLCYDKKKISRVKLYPLSTLLYFGTEAKFVSEQDQTCGLDPDFERLDKKISSESINTGRLLTCPIYDYDGGQKYQFRENLAYSISITDPNAEAVLIPLGEKACRQYGGCDFVLKNGQVQPDLPLPCTDQFDRIGFGDLTGRLATIPFSTDGCNHVVIFAGVAFCMSDDCSSFRALPLGTHYGVSSLPDYKNEQYPYRSRFYSVEGDLGFHVLSEIDNFIVEHGGYEISGEPISAAYSQTDPAIWRQCFENYCVDYNMTLPRGQNIKLIPLGDIAASRLEPGLLARPVYSNYSVNFYLGEQQPYIARDAQQSLTLNVFNAQNQPIDDLNFVLTLESADGILLGEYSFPPTDAQGKTQLVLGPIEGNSGDIFEYSVCLDLQTAYPMCKSDTFILWP
jgi:hypothetical protein